MSDETTIYNTNHLAENENYTLLSNNVEETGLNNMIYIDGLENSDIENNVLPEIVIEARPDDNQAIGLHARDQLETHRLLICQVADGSNEENYYCNECGIAFETVDNFISAHEPSQVDLDGLDIIEEEEQQWELIENNTENPNDIEPDKLIYGEECLEEHQDSCIEFDDEQFFNQSVKEELEAEEETDKYICYDCRTVFSDLTSAESHDCASSSYNAEIEMTRSSAGNEQVDAATNQKTGFVSCNVCNTVFSSQKNLKFHMKIHKKKALKSIQQALPTGSHTQYNDLNQFFCEICNKSFDQNLLAVHKNMHQNVEEYTCSVCNRKFDNFSSFEMHLKMHTDNNMQYKVKKPRPNQTKRTNNAKGKLMFPCQYCGHEFARPFEKVKHERIHTGEKPYECEVCGKTFRVSYSLTLHLRTHTNIRPYVCSTCNKRFKSHQVYAHHLRTHLSERPYQCDICPKSFRTSVQLYAHKNSHTKPFNCPECNRPFASIYSVKMHMKTHTKLNKSNEHTHRCTVCGAEYSRLFALRLHMKETHAMDSDTIASCIQESQHLTIAHNESKIVDEDPDNSDAAILITAAADADYGDYIDCNNIIIDDAESISELSSHSILNDDVSLCYS